MPVSLPPSLMEELRKAPGFDEGSFLAAHANDQELVSLRLNPAKPVPDFDQCEKVPWCAKGRYLEKRPAFTADPLFHAGCYYVQEASSMFLQHILRHTVDLREALTVLDLAASPGGKSTHIASLVSPESILLSNEAIRSRAAVLEENLIKWGTPHVVVSSNDPGQFSRHIHCYDAILVDAPCSGSGLFRKNEKAVQEWSLDNVRLCSQRQQRILAAVLPALKPGGILIYSTCSYSVAENEDIADWLAAELRLSSVRIPVEEEWGIVESLSENKKCYGYRFYPGKVKGEGFFAAVFRKEHEAEQPLRRNTSRLRVVQKNERAIIEKWIDHYDRYVFFSEANRILALPGALEDKYARLADGLYVRMAGTAVGEIAHGELVPDHQLAMSRLLKKEIRPVEVDRETALKYLRRENIPFINMEPGWALVKYRGYNLGWIKILRDRVNNYYPKNWRILKALDEL